MGGLTSQDKEDLLAPAATLVFNEVSQEQNIRWAERAAQLRAEKPKIEVDDPIPHERVIYEVKFCPSEFLPKGANPIFALTLGENIFVCSTVPGGDSKIEILSTIEDLDPDFLGARRLDTHIEYHALIWMNDYHLSTPLLVYSGSLGKIHVYNVYLKKVVKTLIGHGGSIQELRAHPILSGTFASCSDDNEVRLWNLDSSIVDAYCSVICFGEFGNSATVYSIDFTQNGRFIISASRDSWVHLWSLPEDHRLEKLPKNHFESHRIYYPHFSSAELHDQSVDCIRFYGDLILTHSPGDHIKLWKIPGFSASLGADLPDPPTQHDATTRTRSAFGSGIIRIMTFEQDTSDMIVYTRFDLFPGLVGGLTRPMLAAGGQGYQIKVWDLKSQEQYNAEHEDRDIFLPKQPNQVLNKPLKLKDFIPRFSSMSKAAQEAVRVNSKQWRTRTLAWSSDGKWLVAGCEIGTLFLFER